MLNKHQVDTIDKNDPWARDKLKRKAVAEYLTPLIASIRQPFVISLHSPYGTGKSFFLECWKADLEKADLENQGYKVVLFDAWKTDFSDDPLSAFISSIKKQLSKGDSKIEKKFNDLAKRTGGFLRSKFLPLVLKSASRKLVGDEGIEDFLEDIGANSDEVSDMLGSVALEALATQEMAENSMRDFRGFLAETVEEIVKDAKSEDKQKLIIFVDELDRCKPSYAIEVLESIKHLFAVRGTVFVLAFDETQMKDTIANTYGFNDGGEGYLRKFIDWQFQLPEPELPRYCSFLSERLFEDLGSDTPEYRKAMDIVEGVMIASVTLKLTSRELERTLTHANLLYRVRPDCNEGASFVTGIMIAVFVRNRGQAYQISTDFGAAVEFVSEMMAAYVGSNVRDAIGGGVTRDYLLSFFMTNRVYQEMMAPETGEKKSGRAQWLDEVYSLDLGNYFSDLFKDFKGDDRCLAEICLERISGAAEIHALARKL